MATQQVCCVMLPFLFHIKHYQLENRILFDQERLTECNLLALLWPQVVHCIGRHVVPVWHSELLNLDVLLLRFVNELREVISDVLLIFC